MSAVTIRYTMTSTYTKDVDLDALAGADAPVDDLDALADWAEANGDHPAIDLECTDNWVDSDRGSIVVLDVEEAS